MSTDTALRADPPSAAAGSLEIRPARPADEDARDRFVRAHPRGTFFHLSGWGRCVERVFRHDRCDLLALRGGEVAGILPLMRCRSLAGRRALISMPYAVYGGALGETAEVERALVERAAEQARAEGLGRVELRCREDPGLGLPRSALYATFAKDLPKDPAQVLAGMPKKARAEARKGREKHGLVLREGAWYLEELARLFLENKRGLGSPGLPLRWFRALQEEFGPAVRVHAVHHGSRPVAAVMSFVFRGELLAYYAGTEPGADRELSASNYMYMALQEWAVAGGLARFDFGRSRAGSGAYQFKEHQGFEPRELAYSYVLVRDRAPPDFTPSNPRTQVLRDAWRRMPRPVARLASDWLARYLP